MWLRRLRSTWIDCANLSNVYVCGEEVGCCESQRIKHSRDWLTGRCVVDCQYHLLVL